ncbi:MAG: CocE/NonD family hydrolase [Planctomycetota bacterium]|nr:CocE/NonD family hydrolase [Planctomycetota bacterium]
MSAYRILLVAILSCLSLSQFCHADEEQDSRAEMIRSGFAKFETMIPMRDGTRLFTVTYVPYDASATNRYPILMVRTPYGSGPYGADQYRTRLGPSTEFEKEGFIFVFQDVRGRNLSEGKFVNMRPHREQKSGTDFDESTDTYDTIQWLLDNVAHNNGRVGLWGISYPGFYSSAGCIDSHPALKAVSPQAPIADWFFDDFHRNGAFVLPMGFNFFSRFGVPRPEPTAVGPKRFDHHTRDGYQFFLGLGPLSNVNQRYFKGKIPFWNEMTKHPNYDEFWQSRNILPHLQNVSASVLVVGGWFDTEDLYGPLKTYESIEQKNPSIQNTLVMGPWHHGGWNSGTGRSLGDADFGFDTANLFREKIQFPFFRDTLKGDGPPDLPEAFVFETGANRWRSYNQWPPLSAKESSLHLASEGRLLNQPGASNDATALPLSKPIRQLNVPGATLPQTLAATADQTPWVSDPAKPVPYTQELTTGWARNYMAEDQRFAARRPDVVVLRTETLKQDLTIAGPLLAEMFVSTTGEAADIIVKLIDEFPGEPVYRGLESPIPDDFQSGRQQLVRAGVIRGRFRDDVETPKKFVPGQVTRVDVPLRDIHHTFKKGHRVMLQIQSTWFPFIDRNPQTWVDNIFEAEENDFQPQVHRIHHSQQAPSRITFRSL